MSEPEPRYTVAAVARRLGLAPGTLRTWDRRYGLGPTGHAAGTHRRYTATDLARLERMRTLVLDGVAPAEAARVARGGAADRPLVATTPRPGGPGGPGLAVGRASAATRGLARAAAALDATAAARIARGTVERLGVVAAWETVFVPVLVSAGNRYEATGSGVDIEHLLSECILSTLHRSVASAHHRSGRPVLLASAADDYHSLPMHALAAALGPTGLPVRLLGAATPADALTDAVRRLNPSCVVVWSSLAGTGRAGLFAGLPPQRPAVLAVAAGPGWDDVELPEGVVRVASLREAVDAVESASGLALDA